MVVGKKRKEKSFGLFFFTVEQMAVVRRHLLAKINTTPFSFTFFFAKRFRVKITQKRVESIRQECGGRQCQCFDSICNAQITWCTCRSVLNTFQSISEKRFDNSKKQNQRTKQFCVFSERKWGATLELHTHTSRQHTHVFLSQELFFVFPLLLLSKKKKTRLVFEKITPNKLNSATLIVFHK